MVKDLEIPNAPSLSEDWDIEVETIRLGSQPTISGKGRVFFCLIDGKTWRFPESPQGWIQVWAKMSDVLDRDEFAEVWLKYSSLKEDEELRIALCKREGAQHAQATTAYQSLISVGAIERLRFTFLGGFGHGKDLSPGTDCDFIFDNESVTVAKQNLEHTLPLGSMRIVWTQPVNMLSEIRIDGPGAFKTGGGFFGGGFGFAGALEGMAIATLANKLTTREHIKTYMNITGNEFSLFFMSTTRTPRQIEVASARIAVRVRNATRRGPVSNTQSRTDELVKLAELLKEGLITHDEFNVMKSKIIQM